jgi:hypothetical protein
MAAGENDGAWRQAIGAQSAPYDASTLDVECSSPYDEMGSLTCDGPDAVSPEA